MAKIALTEHGTNKPLELDTADIIAIGERNLANGAKSGLIRLKGQKTDIQTVQDKKEIERITRV